MKNCEEYTILVVDDEEDIRETVVEFMEDEGFDVVQAIGGTEAYALTKAKKIDLIITDINMPEGNGIELMELAKRDDPKRPIIVFFTGHSDMEIRQGQEMGANAIFTKPIKYQLLIDAVKKALAIES